MEEQIVFHNQVIEFFDTKDAKTRLKFLQRATLVAREGPNVGRPLVDSVRDSNISNLKELRLGTQEAIRVLFVFDTDRLLKFLYAGKKQGIGNRWYTKAIAMAERNLRELW